jgi:transposase
MTVIGEYGPERPNVIPIQYRTIPTRWSKFVCRSCFITVVQAPAPARLVEGGIPTEALVAEVLSCATSYPQAQMMAERGVVLDQSTLSFWMGESGRSACVEGGTAR